LESSTLRTLVIDRQVELGLTPAAQRIKPSLRAERSNPAHARHVGGVDCFVADAPRNDNGGFVTLLSVMLCRHKVSIP
jgi:hypothetical protein